MDIKKAIKKANKSYKLFLFSMGIVFLILPLAFLLYGDFSLLLTGYLFLIQFLIILSVTIKINKEYLSFKLNAYKLNIKYGIFKEKITIICEKIAVVHVENIKNEFNIVLISKSKFRNEKFRKVDYGFLKEHPVAGEYYYRVKKNFPEEEFYYIIIKNGGLKKYGLLDTIYKGCVYAVFSDDSIEKIKEYRE